MDRKEQMQMFQQILGTYFEKVKQSIPPQYKAFKDFVVKMGDLLRQESQPKLGRHLVVFRLTTQMKQTRLKELNLQTLMQLVSAGFVDGSQLDSSQEFYTREFDELFQTHAEKYQEQKIIDSLVNSVHMLLMDKDENLQQALKLLVAFVTNPWCDVQAPTLDRIVRTIIYVLTNMAKQQQTERMGKAALIQILNFTFQAVQESIYRNNKRRLSCSHEQRHQSFMEEQIYQISSLIMRQMVDDVQLNRTNRQQMVVSDEYNEANYKAASFGWCIICRLPAVYYCKDFKVSVCSLSCKRKHTELVDLSQKTYDGTKLQYENSLRSAIHIFSSLTQLLSNSKSQVLKNQLIILELIQYALDLEYFRILKKEPQVIKIVKDQLCSQLLKFCFETDRVLNQLSFKIFQSLVFVMRKSLKHEISIFLNQIYLKILLSTNSLPQHKLKALESLLTIFQKPKLILEFYMNYDCNMKQECLIEKIIDTIHQILIGQIYQKQEYQITASQDKEIRNLCSLLVFKIIGNIKTALDKYSSKQNAIEQLAQDEEEPSMIQYVNPIEKQRQQKQEILKGSSLFNQNPEKGINFLIQRKLLTENGIAAFFRETSSLSKDAVGEYLGGHKPRNLKVLTDYTNSQRFSLMSVEQALRAFLDLFTLPGEAQQVDRIVQKFSERYFLDNQGTQYAPFKSSNAVYTFTYLLVMLQTDLHNPQVKEKMKLQDFIKLAGKINDGDDLPSDMLTQTYQSILKNPLALHEKQKANLLKESQNKGVRQKLELFQKEKDALIQSAKEMIKTQQESLYVKVDHSSVMLVGPLLESIGEKVFEILMLPFNQDSSELYYPKDSIPAINHFFQLNAQFSNPLETYIQKLVQATKIQGLSLSVRRMSLVQTILQLVPSIGNGLQELGWKTIFELISRLDELRQLQSTKSDQSFDILSYIPDLSLEFDFVDKVFISSKNLDDEVFQHLISALCIISKQEIYSVKPRQFCLQKLVEVSDYNMDRVKNIWEHMWKVVKDHINEVAVKEKSVALFAVDSLKQLSIKFLQKEDSYSQLANSDRPNNIQFQREVLKPFEVIFLNTPDVEVKEFILNCINILVLSHKNNLKNGWRVIFDLINLGLKEENKKVTSIAYQILNRIMKYNLDLIQDVFVDLIHTLTILGKKEDEQMALSAIEFVSQCLHYLSLQAQVQSKQNWDDPNVQEAEQEEENQRNTFSVPQLEMYWVPILSFLSVLAGDKRTRVQANSMETIFKLLNQYGHAFSQQFWKIVFQSVLRPLFDEIQYTFQQLSSLNSNQSSPEEHTWFKNSCKQGFAHITNLLSRYYTKMSYLLPDFLKLFENCIQNQNEKLAKFSVQAVKIMVQKIGDQFKEEQWAEFVAFLNRMLQQTTPKKLLNPQENTPPKLSKQQSNRSLMKSLTEESYSQCSSQLLFIQITNQIVEKFCNQISVEQLSILESSCQSSYQFAKSFNSQIEHRYNFWKNGFMSTLDNLPGLLKQEREAYACMLTIKQAILQKIKNQPSYASQLEDYFVFLSDSIKNFNSKHEKFHRREQEVSAEQDQNIKKLKLQEIEREALNSRTLLDSYILPKIHILTDDQLKNAGTNLFDLLLNASQYSSELSWNQLICKDCSECKKCAQSAKTGLDQQIRKTLKRLYDLKV